MKRSTYARCRYPWGGHTCARHAGLGPHTHRCVCGQTALSPHPYDPAPGALGALCWCGHGADDQLHRQAEEVAS